LPDRIKKLRDFIGIPRKKNFASWNCFIKSPITTWFLLLGLAVLVAFLTKFSFVGIPKNIEVGAIATRDIKAYRNYEIVDTEATDKLREDAVLGVLPIYDFDENCKETLITKISAAFESARSEIKSQPHQKKDMKAFLDNLRTSFSTGIGFEVPEKIIKGLFVGGFSRTMENEIKNVVKRICARAVVQDESVFSNPKANEVIIRYISGEAENRQEKEVVVKEPSKIIIVNDLKKEISQTKISDDRIRNREAREAVVALAELMVVPNITPNQSEYRNRQDLARKSIQDVILKVKSGEMIIRNGARFDVAQIKVLNGIRKERSRKTYPIELISAIFFTLLSIIVIFYFAERFIIRFNPSRLDYMLMALLALVHVIVMRLGFSFAPALHDALPMDIPVNVLIYAIPMASSTMLIRMLLQAEEAFVYVVLISLLTGLFVNVDLQLILFFILSNIAAIIAIAHIDKRSSIIRAGAITGLINIAAILTIKFLGLSAIAISVTFAEIVYYMICAFWGGMFSAVLAMIVAPLIESLLGYTTDIKLLELANLNHPLLRELIIRAPGTYHHSHLIGIIGEAAAEAIGANALLVRVAAYYHDIGKIKKPTYFVENAKNSEDKHAKLSPHMSSLIISSHVKDGIDMGQDAKLPRSIVDMIKQHHGTRTISFFYEKAKAMNEGTDKKLDPTDFEYKGPKPQTREAAILMLADISEAAVRALKEKGVTRIQQTVDRMIHTCFSEKQLDECDLTLRDLNEISKAFTHILLGIYHQRIEYQKSDDTKSDENGLNGEKNSGDNSLQSPSNKKDTNDQASPSSEKDDEDGNVGDKDSE